MLCKSCGISFKTCDRTNFQVCQNKLRDNIELKCLLISLQFKRDAITFFMQKLFWDQKLFSKEKCIQILTTVDEDPLGGCEPPPGG